MRVGVVGVGVAGSSHLFDLASSDHFVVAAVCGRRPDRVAVAARRYGALAIYDDLATMFADARLDAVVIATPPHVSPAITAMSLAAGLPTLIDKPAGDTTAAIDGVRHSAGTAAALAVVGYNRRYQSHVHQARRVLQAEGIGQLVHVTCRWSGPFTRRYSSAETYRIRVGRGDGVVLDTASHVIDTLLFLGLGPLVVRQARLRCGPTGADVAAHVELYSPTQDLPVSVRVDDSGDIDTWQISIRGTRGELCLSRTELAGTSDTGLIVASVGDLGRPVDDLVHLAGGRPTCGASLAEAAAVLTVIDGIRNAAGQRRPWLRPRAKALGRLNGAC